MTSGTSGMTIADRVMLRRLCNQAYKRRGFETDGIYINNYHVMLRHSWPPWPADGLLYETLDVVQLGYGPYVRGECELTDVPKRGAVDLLHALEDCCREKGIALRIECIGDDKVRKYYIREHQFRPENWGGGMNYSTSVIKPLDAAGQDYK